MIIQIKNKPIIIPPLYSLLDLNFTPFQLVSRDENCNFCLAAGYNVGHVVSTHFEVHDEA